MGRHRKNRDGCSFGAHGGIRAAQKQKKIVWSEIKWVDKVFYNNEVENVKFLKSGSLAFGHFGKELFEVFKYIGVPVDEIGYNQPAGVKYPTENPWG